MEGKKNQFNPLGLSNSNDKLLIAGPCSAETEAQTIETALQMAGCGVTIFRAGAWKPRTRPGGFEGKGQEALKWIKLAGKVANLPVITEVATPEHVRLALEAEIDMLWIGARTSVNPFAMQEIAEALKGVDVPVFVKNPINPDLELWIGALERLSSAGVRRIAAIHRGFSTYETVLYRNKPNWEIPIELKRLFPGLTVLCDPSHISGSRDSVGAIAQNALDLNFDGLMIEVHCRPDEALSDKKQQLSPAGFKKLLGGLVYRKEKIEDVLANTFVEELRATIDKIDDKIIEYIAQRMDLARVIGLHKREHNVTILQKDRWDEVVKTRTDLGVNKDLNAAFVLRLFELIHQEAIFHQDVVMNQNTAITPKTTQQV